MFKRTLLLLTLGLIIGVYYGQETQITGPLARPGEMATHLVTRYQQGQENQMGTPDGRDDGTGQQVHGHRGVSEVGETHRPFFVREEVKPVTNEMFLFWAPWCTKCTTMKTIAASLKKAGYKVTLINTDEHSEMVKKYNVAQIPQTIIFEETETTPRVVKQFVGTMDSKTLKKYLKKPTDVPPTPPTPPDPEEPDYDIW
jgi:thiol-disulfide isomerase/thioredoxin